MMAHMKQIPTILTIVTLSLVFAPNSFARCYKDRPVTTSCPDQCYSYNEYKVDNACVDFCLDYEHSLSECQKSCTN